MSNFVIICAFPEEEKLLSVIDILIALIKSLHLDISIPVVVSYMIGNIYIVKKKILVIHTLA